MIKCSIHPTFFFIFLLALIYGFIYDVLLLFFIVFIHELGHAYAAIRFGWRIRGMQLLPFGGELEVEEHGNKPVKEEVLVTLAGPALNLFMIGLALLALYYGLGSAPFFLQFLEYNLIILLFNLLPIWPLDGGKLTQSLFSCWWPYKRAIRFSLHLSASCLVLYILLVLFMYPFYFSLWIVAIFLTLAQWLEYKQSPYQFFRFLLNKFRETRETGLIEKVIYIRLFPQDTVQRALEKLYRHKQHYFYLTNSQGELVTLISELELLEQYFTYHQPYRAVGDIFR